MALSLPVKLGIIGGSGIYQMPGVELLKEHSIETPFGDPSDKVIEGKLHGRTVYFLPRHGKGHRLTPSEVNYRANIYALKSLGVTHVLAVSAVGIMKEHIKPGDMVVPDQIFDRTKGRRADTFFGEGIVGHFEFADPFDAEFSQWIVKAARTVTDRVHFGGTYVCMEGPAFSTRAESKHYRETLRPAVIGMTAVPEAKLAREAELCYGMLALATDYDCWHEGEDDVSVEAVLAVLKGNGEKANNIVKALVQELPEQHANRIFSLGQFAIMTARELIPEHRKQALALLWGKYLG